MSENKKLKNFLTNGFQSKEEPKEEAVEEETEMAEATGEVDLDQEIENKIRERTEALDDTVSGLKANIDELQLVVKELRENPPFPDMTPFVTTREQIKSLTAAIDRQNIEITNKNLVASMEQIAIMREDFFKLCSGMRKKIDTMSAKDVLSSFEAYEVDMENILTDGGVFIGHFPYESLNTIHQRIVEVIPTDDPELNGKIAERLSDGYKLGNRVLLKEKVSVYKFIEKGAQETASEETVPGPAEAPAAASKTTSKTSSAKKEKKTSIKANTEEEE